MQYRCIKSRNMFRLWLCDRVLKQRFLYMSHRALPTPCQRRSGGISWTSTFFTVVSQNASVKIATMHCEHFVCASYECDANVIISSFWLRRGHSAETADDPTLPATSLLLTPPVKDENLESFWEIFKQFDLK